MSRLPDILIAPVVRLALAEDLGRAGDVTAMACTFGSSRPTVSRGEVCAASLRPSTRAPSTRLP